MNIISSILIDFPIYYFYGFQSVITFNAILVGFWVWKMSYLIEILYRIRHKILALDYAIDEMIQINNDNNNIPNLKKHIHDIDDEICSDYLKCDDICYRNCNGMLYHFLHKYLK
jgi:hypothetical protein